MLRGVDEVVECDGLIAVRAGSSWADSATEEAAVGAALLAELAGAAVGAFVDRRFSPSLGGGSEGWAMVLWRRRWAAWRQAGEHQRRRPTWV